MFNSNNGYSLSDIAAATGKGDYCNDGMWGNGAWWIIILFLFVFMGRGGYGLFGGEGATASGITDGYILTSDFANIERKSDSVNNGLCDGFYAINTGMLNGFSGVENAITQQTIANMQNTNAIGSQLTSLGTQMQQCCCDIRYENASKFADLNYNLATQSCQTRQAINDSTRDIIASQEAGTRAILDFMTQDKIAALTSENASLKAAANNAAQTYDIVSQLKQPCAVPAYVVPNPYCNCNSQCGGYVY